MLTFLALFVAVILFIIIRASARTVITVISVTALIVLSTTHAQAAPGLGACGECTSNVFGLSVDYVFAIALAVIAVVTTAWLHITNK